jgi:tripartite-type tricarboxylate transporter receptor subunit TctC
MGHMGTHGAAPGMIADLGYDPNTDFAPVGMVAGTPVVLVARKGLARDFPDLIALLRKEGANATMAHAGRGSISHAATLLFCSVLDVSPRLVAFSGTGPALIELVAGRIDAMIDQIVNVMAPIELKQVDGYAIAADGRSDSLPRIPTAEEAGLDLGINAWNALFAAARTPPDQIQALNLALNRALDDDRTKARMLDLGAELPKLAQRTPDALGALVNAEVKRWRIPLGLRGVQK